MDFTDRRRPPWDRPHYETGESESDYDLFRAYRSSPIVVITEWARQHADDHGLAESTIKHKAGVHRWKHRKRAFLAAAASREAADAVAYMEAAEGARRRLSGLLMELATEGLEDLLARGPEDLTVSEAAKIADLAHRLGSLDDGAATARVDVPGLAEALAGLDVDALLGDEDGCP